MEGVSKEFVSIQMNHNLRKKTFTFTQEEYWDKAIIRFKEFIGEKGPKVRLDRYPLMTKSYLSNLSLKK